MSISLPAFKEFTVILRETHEQVNKCVFAGGIVRAIGEEHAVCISLWLGWDHDHRLRRVVWNDPRASHPRIPQWVLQWGSRMVVKDPSKSYACGSLTLTLEEASCPQWIWALTSAPLGFHWEASQAGTNKFGPWLVWADWGGHSPRLWSCGLEADSSSMECPFCSFQGPRWTGAVSLKPLKSVASFLDPGFPCLPPALSPLSQSSLSL